MAQKDKVKELVGRGLDSYHTKALQQIDRINKKNKEQNHKISILSNELDNDYLTKTEEGSVISLEHSKEGMVYLDELQGNTLVNYCTDGSKEMTLNGDIDLEGTFVTLTEGVDNGKVDVMCEGNTLVNLSTIGSATFTERFIRVPLPYDLKKGTIYTLCLKQNNNTLPNGFVFRLRIGLGGNTNLNIRLSNEDNIINFTPTLDGLNYFEFYTSNSDDITNGYTATLSDIIMLEGDWTNKEIPPYFEGMKSVGECEDNKIEILSQNADRTQQNKKEILINEPLRGLPNGIKDKFVKQNGKWYIERNCLEYKPTSNDGWMIDNGGTNGENYLCCYTLKSFLINNSSYISRMILCDKLPFGEKSFTKEMCCYSGAGYFEFILKVTTLDEFKARLDELKPTVIVPTLTPTYEEITDVELITYLDTTHISNNSTIPCNMKVKNSGYNAIIKPSTLYTVALDTNKSGTIGMNLGGVKGTTTNNVLTLTTPTTLSDDSLRLYGKGIKGSKVRLLEGNKTNWIPSHFEGMKSSFEDKFDTTDNTYKMEILSNNKNILDLSKHDGVTTYTYHGVTFSYDDKTQEFTVNGTATQDLGYQPLLYSNDRFLVFDQNKQYTLSTTTLIPFTVQISERNVVPALTLHANSKFKNRFDRVDVNYCNTKMNYFMLWGISKGDTFNNLKFKLQIEEGNSNTEYISNKSNKIQFSSIEPLRSVGNTKDKFVFKNNKLMIERNIGEITIKDTILSTSKSSDTNRTYTTRFVLDKKLFPNIKLQTGNAFKSDRFKHTSWSLDVEGFDVGSNLDFNILNIRLSSLDVKGLAEWFKNNPTKFAYILAEPTYEEIPFELQKIILEGYENGTLFFDTNIPPTSTVTYAGETPIVKSAKSNRVEVASSTTDINDNIIPYLCDMDYRIVVLELQQGQPIQADFYKLFGGVYEMLKRDILSKRLSKSEYEYRLTDYFNVGKLTEQQVRELEDLINE